MPFQRLSILYWGTEVGVSSEVTLNRVKDEKYHEDQKQYGHIRRFLLRHFFQRTLGVMREVLLLQACSWTVIAKLAPGSPVVFDFICLCWTSARLVVIIS